LAFYRDDGRKGATAERGKSLQAAPKYPTNDAFTSPEMKISAAAKAPAIRTVGAVGLLLPSVFLNSFL